MGLGGTVAGGAAPAASRDDVSGCSSSGGASLVDAAASASCGAAPARMMMTGMLEADGSAAEAAPSMLSSAIEGALGHSSQRDAMV